MTSDLNHDLIQSILNDDLEGVRRAIASGADPNARIRSGGSESGAVDSPAILLAARLSRRDAIRVLLDNGADVDATEGPNGNTSLMAMCRDANTSEDASTIKLLLDAGARTDVRSRSGHTALDYAALSASELIGGKEPEYRYEPSARLDVLRMLIEGSAPFGKRATQYRIARIMGDSHPNIHGIG